MTKPLRTWVVTASAAAGVIGGGIVAAAAASGPDTSSPTASRTHDVADPASTAAIGQLRSRIDELLAKEQRLQHRADQARQHLRTQLTASRNSASPPATFVPAQPAPDVHQPVHTVSEAAPAPVPTHARSGASGASGSGRHGDGEGEREGGDDD